MAKMIIESRVPSKWRFVDMKTGGIWQLDVNKDGFTDSISRKPHALARGVCQHLLRQTIDDPDIYVEVKDAGEVKMIWNNN